MVLTRRKKNLEECPLAAILAFGKQENIHRTIYQSRPVWNKCEPLNYQTHPWALWSWPLELNADSRSHRWAMALHQGRPKYLECALL